MKEVHFDEKIGQAYKTLIKKIWVVDKGRSRQEVKAVISLVMTKRNVLNI